MTASLTFLNNTKWPRQVHALVDPCFWSRDLIFWRFERKRMEGKKEEILEQGKYYVCGWNEERRKNEGKHLKKENIFFAEERKDGEEKEENICRSKTFLDQIYLCGGEEKRRRKREQNFFSGGEGKKIGEGKGWKLSWIRKNCCGRVDGRTS